MTVGYAIADYGEGTIQGAVSGTNVPVLPNSNTVVGDLLVCVGYISGDATAVKDAGDGWLIVDCGYDSGSGIGIFLACLVARWNGSSGYAGLTLPASIQYTSQVTSYRLSVSSQDRHPFRFAPEFASGSRGAQGWFYDSASGSAMTVPEIIMPYAQAIDFTGGGYTTGGTGTNIGAPSGMTEEYETVNATTNVEITLARQFVNSGSLYKPLIASALSQARTNRGRCRAMVPILGDVGSQRFMSYRRIS